MALLEGKLGEKINCLLDESNNQFDLGKYELSIQTLIKAWNELPNKKYDYSESYLIVWGILDIAIKINDFNTMKKWVEKIFLADPERGDTGEREMWAGRIAYELGNMTEALEYFKIANIKSKGRCFWERDNKYKDFFMKNI